MNLTKTSRVSLRFLGAPNRDEIVAAWQNRSDETDAGLPLKLDQASANRLQAFVGAKSPVGAISFKGKDIHELTFRGDPRELIQIKTYVRGLEPGTGAGQVTLTFRGDAGVRATFCLL